MSSPGGGHRFTHEESRPFPKMKDSPPGSSVSSPAPTLSSLDSYDDPNIDLNDQKDEAQESSVHPSDRIFQWTEARASDETENGASSDNGPVTLTNLTPISPSNEDVHTSEQYKHPQPFLNRPAAYFPNPAGCGFLPYSAISFQPQLFGMPENEKYRKMMLKKQKRASKKERNVVNVMKSEEIDGHTDLDIDKVLQSIGETVDEDKKSKVKKPKEKVERTKSIKKDKRKSLEKDHEDKEEEEEEKEEQSAEDKDTKSASYPKNVRNKIIEDDLMDFKQNFYLVSSDQAKTENTNGAEEVVFGSPHASFTKVTSKKNRVKKTKDETVKNEVLKIVPQESTRINAANIRPRDHDIKDNYKPATSDINKDSDLVNTLTASEATFIQTAEDFPALGGGVKSVPIISNDSNAQIMPACAWAKVVTKASDIKIDNTDNTGDMAGNVAETPKSDHGGEVTSDDNKNNEQLCDELDEAAVIDYEVPKYGEPSEEDSDEVKTVADEEEATENNNNNNCDEDVKVEVITIEDEFEKKETNKNSPVVIFSEKNQDWTSSEFTFGFDINEELIGNVNPEVDATGQDSQHYWQEQCDQVQAPMSQLSSIDSVDNAILSFGAAGSDMRPLIVGVPVGVPIPVSSCQMPYQFYPGMVHPGYPPVYGMPYPQPVPLEDDNELMPEKMIPGEHNLEDHTISPESGISSSSPLSWQHDSSPSLPAGQHTRSLPLASQVSESLSNWSGHHSDDESTLGPGWATQVEAEENPACQDSGLSSSDNSNASGINNRKKTEKFNFVEIVNFISNSWSVVSEDTNVQVFNVGAGAN